MLKRAIQKSLLAFGYSIHKTQTVANLAARKEEAEHALKEARMAMEESSGALALAASRHRDNRASVGPSPIMDAYSALPNAEAGHAAGAFVTAVLRRLEQILPASIENSAETGCGKSTILFSNISKRHKVFAFDDQNLEHSSVRYFRECPLTKLDRVEAIFGATQKTLPDYHQHPAYDVVLLDGPHGYPFPDLEYFFFYPHIKPGGYLIVDDVAIPSIGRMADFLAEDEMFDLVEIIYFTAVFRRTSAPTFSPYADGWWEQRYNRRRISPKREIHLADGRVFDRVSSLDLDVRHSV